MCDKIKNMAPRSGYIHIIYPSPNTTIEPVTHPSPLATIHQHIGIDPNSHTKVAFEFRSLALRIIIYLPPTYQPPPHNCPVPLAVHPLLQPNP